jgi:hypothetical protein
MTMTTPPTRSIDSKLSIEVPGRQGAARAGFHALSPSEAAVRREAGDARVLNFRPPDAGADFNERLRVCVERKFKGDVRRQIGWYCEHAQVADHVLQRAGGGSGWRGQTVKVLHLCVTDLRHLTISVKDLSALSQKNILRLGRRWAEQGLAASTIKWRYAVIASFWQTLDRYMPLLKDDAPEDH